MYLYNTLHTTGYIIHTSVVMCVSVSAGHLPQESSTWLWNKGALDRVRDFGKRISVPEYVVQNFESGR